MLNLGLLIYLWKQGKVIRSFLVYTYFISIRERGLDMF